MFPNFGRSDQEYIAKLERRVQELEDGSCRFNCRTNRDAFVSGFEMGKGFRLTDEEREKVIKYYREWVKSDD